MIKTKKGLFAGAGLIAVIVAAAVFAAGASMTKSNAADIAAGKKSKTAIEERTLASDIVLVATAVRTEASLVTDESGNQAIYTTVTLAVDEWLKGGTPSQVTLTMIGGTLPDGLNMAVENYGAPSPAHAPKKGDRAVYFLKRTDDGLKIVGDEFGQIELEKSGRAKHQEKALDLASIKAQVKGVK